MDEENKLLSFTDNELLGSLDRLVNDSRRVEADIVAHIAEVDHRRLYEGQACSSMFAYCTQVLHLSESETYLRIAVARATRVYPQILGLLAANRIHMTAIAKLARHLSAENVDRVLSRAVHRSKRQVEELAAELSPKPDVPNGIRKLPQRRVAATSALPRPELDTGSADESELRPDGVDAGVEQLRPDGVEPSREDLLVDTPARPSKVEPLAPERYRVQFTASAALRDKLERLEALMQSSLPEGDLAECIEVAVTEKLERLEAKRLGRTKNPRKNDDSSTVKSAKGRHIPAATKRVVSARDKDRCTFVGPEGRRCTETRHLEFHHEDPYARGPDHSPANVRLLCRAHNLHLAELDYGYECMAPYRRSTSTVREARPRYGIAELGRHDPVRAKPKNRSHAVSTDNSEGGIWPGCLTRRATSLLLSSGRLGAIDRQLTLKPHVPSGIPLSPGSPHDSFEFLGHTFESGVCLLLTLA